MELSDFASESVIVSDERGVIKYWNAASEALYGWPATAMIGQNFAALGAPRHHDGEHIGALLREGRWEGVVRRRNLAGAEGQPPCGKSYGGTPPARYSTSSNTDGTRE